MQKRWTLGSSSLEIVDPGASWCVGPVIEPLDRPPQRRSTMGALRYAAPRSASRSFAPASHGRHVRASHRGSDHTPPTREAARSPQPPIPLAETGKSSCRAPARMVDAGQALPNRVKLGFADSVERRLAEHQTAAPTAKVLRSWPCKRSWDFAAMDSITRTGCKLVLNEVYEGDVQGFIDRAEAFFAVMPHPDSERELSEHSPLSEANAPDGSEDEAGREGGPTTRWGGRGSARYSVGFDLAVSAVSGCVPV